MQQSIRNLDDATAIRVLKTCSIARSRDGDYQTQWTSELRQAFADEVAEVAAATVVNEGDLAREALLLLADDLDNQEPLRALIQNPAPKSFLDPETVAIGVAGLIALQAPVKFERTKSGKIYFKIEKKPLPVELMKKLISYFTGPPSDDD